jgi:hypothetical protein
MSREPELSSSSASKTFSATAFRSLHSSISFWNDADDEFPIVSLYCQTWVAWWLWGWDKRAGTGEKKAKAFAFLAGTSRKKSEKKKEFVGPKRLRESKQGLISPSSEGVPP